MKGGAEDGRDALAKYRAKRDFTATTEPAGDAPARERDTLDYVVQKHAASSLHYDFRLEWGGVLKSWAIPKGPSDDPSVKRLAIETEDHPLEYAAFEGDIPEGHYGAGHVEIWDRGSWSPAGDAAASFRDGHLKFDLHGKRYSGRWTLLRLRGERQWLLRKVAGDVPADPLQAPASAAPAGSLVPMLATLVDRVPTEGRWAYETKYDGYRMLCRIGDGAVRFLSRNGNEWTPRLQSLADRIAGLPIAKNGCGWLDGEVVVFGDDGVSNFQALQATLDGVGSRPVFVAFDVLQWDGRDYRDAPCDERTAALAKIIGRVGKDSPLQRSVPLQGEAEALWAEACRRGWEGLIGKRIDSRYRAGRSKDWIKLKCRPRQEVIVGGWSEPAGAREHFGALLVGVREGDGKNGKLRYAGRVGTGFTASTLAALKARLHAVAGDRSPFDLRSPRGAGIHWTRPELVVEVSFASWTSDGQLRQAAFEGVREDKRAAEVEREVAVTPSTQDDVVAGVRITHPERVIFEATGATKLDLARYYARVCTAFHPELDGRPLSLLRCPDGAGSKCFFQKHLKDGLGGIARIDANGKEPAADSEDADAEMVAKSLEGVVRLVQRGVIEFHTWGSRAPLTAHANRITIDLDPDDNVPWPAVIEGAQLARGLFDELGMHPFLKTTGGKGLHLVAPIEAGPDWTAVRSFAQRFAKALEHRAPDRFIATMSKVKRKDRIFVDYLRNAEEATAIAAWSARARPSGPVSMPLLWDELDPAVDIRGAYFNIGNAHERMDSKAQQAWAAMFKSATPLGRFPDD